MKLGEISMTPFSESIFNRPAVSDGAFVGLYGLSFVGTEPNAPVEWSFRIVRKDAPFYLIACEAEDTTFYKVVGVGFLKQCTLFVEREERDKELVLVMEHVAAIGKPLVDKHGFVDPDRLKYPV